MHPNNVYHNAPPNFTHLATAYPVLQPYLISSSTAASGVTINFQDSEALRVLTECLLRRDWGWEVELRREGLCPTLANRLDYICYLAALIPHLSAPITSEGRGLKVLDIGTGAVAIYPLLWARLQPSAQFVATEIEEPSFKHAVTTRDRNAIPPERMDIRLVQEDDRILSPLFEDRSTNKPFTFTMCNPPFYDSREEMAHSSSVKSFASHAAERQMGLQTPTAAANELITPGGEVAFVGQMISESLKDLCLINLGLRNRWFTSLLGKASSIAPLVELLKQSSIDNYFLISSQQAHTVRWILGWSFTAIRLPDALVRTPTPAITKHLPPPNHLTYHPPALTSAANLIASMLRVLVDVNILAGVEPFTVLKEVGEGEYLFRPREIGWTRAARRARIGGGGGKSAETGEEGEKEALFDARLVVRAEEGTGRIELHWMRGRERKVVAGFWAFLVRKVGGECLKLARAG